MEHFKDIKQDNDFMKDDGLFVDFFDKPDDLEVVLLKVLIAALEKVNRPGGLIIVQSSIEQRPLLLVTHQINPVWEKEINIQDSQLRRLINSVISSGSEINVDSVPDVASLTPLLAQGDIQGALLVSGNRCSPDEQVWLNSLGQRVGRYIQDKRAFNRGTDINKNLALFQMVSKIISSNIDYDETQKQLLIDICKILDAEISGLALWNEEINQLVIKRYSLNEHDLVYFVRAKQEDGILDACLSSQTAIIVNDLDSEPMHDSKNDFGDGFTAHSILCAPLLVENRVIGTLQLFNKLTGKFDLADKELLITIAKWVAYTFYNSSLVRQIKVDNAELEASRWELLRSRNTLRALFDSLPLSMYIVDRKYNLIAVNMNRSVRVNDKPNILVGRLCYEALYQRNDPCPGCRVSETLFGGQDTMRTERRWETGAEPFEWEISTYPIHGGTGQTLQAVIVEQDVTEKRRLETTLAQSEKLAAVGQLAAGCAHDINNPLAAIIANAQMLHRQLPPDPDLRESLDLILQAGARASQVVHNLLDFARKEQYEFLPTDLNETIQNSLSLVQHEIVSRSIELKFEPGKNLPLIMASKDHLQGVWLNLIMNAMDALRGEGHNEIRITTQVHGNEFRVIVADTGTGMPPERIPRIFEPFYTTKESGRGTGLGLSLCHRIVKQHGGHIEVDSQVGIGTRVTVVLPVTPG